MSMSLKSIETQFAQVLQPRASAAAAAGAGGTATVDTGARLRLLRRGESPRPSGLSLTPRVRVASARPATRPMAGLIPDSRADRAESVLLIVIVLGLAGAGVVARRTTAGIAEQREAKRALPPNLPLPAVDDFRRADAVRLGRAQSGQSWVQLGGLWAIRDGRAVLLRPAARGTSLALLRTGAPGGTVTLDAANPVSGAGLAFRCRNLRNCWFLEAVPEYGTWNVVRVVDGRRTKVANLGVVPIAPGKIGRAHV